MKLFLPKNIYAMILAGALKKQNNFELIYKDSSLIAGELASNTSALGLIPCMDLINHRNLFVSGKAGVSFDGLLSNSYFYLSQNSERELGNIYLRGDVSLNEIILTKVMFEEKYSAKVDVTLDTAKEPDLANNFLIVGDDNFKSWDFSSGLSFSDQIADILDLPYVNFIVVSQDKESIEYFNSLVENIDETIEDGINEVLNSLEIADPVKTFLLENLGSVYYEITQNEIDALHEIFKVVYYRGILDDIFDVNII